MTLVSDAPGAAPAGRGEFDRTPPQAIEAEQSVLGAMMLSKDAIADVVEVIKPGDFYRPAHQLIYDSVLDLYARGEPADAVTVSAELTRTGQLARIGGATYLHTLISMVPTAANAGYYAAIVAERATLRRLVTAGTRIVQMGYDASSGSNDIVGTVDDVVDRAQAEIYEVTERRTSEDYVHIETLLHPTLDEIEKISATGGIGTGIPTGFHQLDEITNGLHPGQMITVAGRPGSGKALALDTALPTPTGWTTMGRVGVAEQLIGADGVPTRVLAVTDVMTGRPCYEVEFDDGSVLTADAGHQWLVRPATTVTPAFTAATAVTATAHLVPTTLQPVRPTWPAQQGWLHGQARRADVATFVDGAAPGSGARGSDGAVAELSAGTTFGAAGALYGRRATTAVQAAGDPLPGDAAPAFVFTTEELAVRTAGAAAAGTGRYAVACAAPLTLPVAALQVPPYMLGACLGEGPHAGAALIGDDVALVAQLQAEGAHIPPRYLRAGEAQRRALLRGLLDTHGYVGDGGTVEVVVGSARLAADVGDLVTGLGYVARLSASEPGAPDTGVADTGVADTGVADTGVADTGVADTGVADTGVADTGVADTGGAEHDSADPSRTSWTVAFTTADRVFGLRRESGRAVAPEPPGCGERVIVAVRAVESVPVRCVQVDNADHLYLAGRAMVPTHNSTLALDVARSAAVKHRKTTAIFSLEMGKLEIMMRLFSAEAGVALQNMRSGHMSDQDWRRLALRSSELAEAPLFIDDSPNLTMMEIRAKARRLSQRHDLALIVIDYLQLMTSGKRVESRQQEVSEFSRAMKLLAKELNVPVVALSQLNRGPEQRTDKRPLLSDLRESGCLPASALVWRADTGAQVPIGELYTSGARDIAVWALDERMHMVRRRMSHVFCTGVRPVWRLTLASGRVVQATTNHPLFTYDGWQALGDLTVGAAVAVPRSVGAPAPQVHWPTARVTLLAHLLGGGAFATGAVRYASHDSACAEVVASAAAACGFRVVRESPVGAVVHALRLAADSGSDDSLGAWLGGLGVLGARYRDVVMPAAVAALGDAQLALFLAQLWSASGRITVDPSTASVDMRLGTPSRSLADGVLRLLARFGVLGRIEVCPASAYVAAGATALPTFEVHIDEARDQAELLRRFVDADVVPQRGAVAALAALAAAPPAAKPKATGDADAMWARVDELLAEPVDAGGRPFTSVAPPLPGGADAGLLPQPASTVDASRLARVVAVLDAADYDLAATNDLHWDEVVSVESVGSEQVFDATVAGEHNFVADGVVVHNSIEQDSDLVVLVHRPDLYEPETERAGEADLIIAKHRNGPTATVAVAFQGRYSRFADMPN